MKLNTNIVLTTPKIAGLGLITITTALCFVQPDNARMYWTTAIPTAGALLTADSIGDSFISRYKFKNGSYENI